MHGTHDLFKQPEVFRVRPLFFHAAGHVATLFFEEVKLGTVQNGFVKKLLPDFLILPRRIGKIKPFCVKVTYRTFQINPVQPIVAFKIIEQRINVFLRFRNTVSVLNMD